MSANLASVLYLVSGVLFILALRGLSGPETSRMGNRLGMVGMAIAVLTTLAVLAPQGALDPVTVIMILVGVGIGDGSDGEGEGTSNSAESRTLTASSLV